MRKLGNVVSIRDGKLVIKAEGENLAKIGTKVFDEKGQFVGPIIDFFGPIKGPYMVVSPRKKPDQYLNQAIFY